MIDSYLQIICDRLCVLSRTPGAEDDSSTNSGEEFLKSLEKMCALHSTESASYCHTRDGIGDAFVGRNHLDRRKTVFPAELEKIVPEYADQKARLSEKLASAEGKEVTPQPVRLIPPTERFAWRRQWCCRPRLLLEEACAATNNTIDVFVGRLEQPTRCLRGTRLHL